MEDLQHGLAPIHTVLRRCFQYVEGHLTPPQIMPITLSETAKPVPGHLQKVLSGFVHRQRVCTIMAAREGDRDWTARFHSVGGFSSGAWLSVPLRDAS